MRSRKQQPQWIKAPGESGLPHTANTILAYTRGSSGSDVAFFNLRSGHNTDFGNVHLMTSSAAGGAGMVDLESEVQRGTSAHTICSLHNGEIFSQDVSIHGDRLYDKQTVLCCANNRDYTTMVIAASLSGKVAAKKLLDGTVSWTGGAMVFANMSSQVMPTTFSQMMIFDIGRGGKIEVSSTGPQMRTDSFWSAIPFSETTALASTRHGYSLIDVHAPGWNFKEARSEISSKDVGKHGIVAGCRAFFADMSCNYNHDETSSESLITRQAKRGAPPGAMLVQAGPHIEPIASLFSWHPAHPQVVAVTRSRNQPVGHLIMMNARRHTCVNLPTIDDSRPAPLHVFTPGSVCGMDVIYAMNSETCATSVLV